MFKAHRLLYHSTLGLRVIQMRSREAHAARLLGVDVGANVEQLAAVPKNV